MYTIWKFGMEGVQSNTTTYLLAWLFFLIQSNLGVQVLFATVFFYNICNNALTIHSIRQMFGSLKECNIFRFAKSS
jgi:hypothetical protein